MLGDNAFGQLGDGTANQQNDASIVAASISGAISIDVGRRHTCIVSSSDSLHCWGGSGKASWRWKYLDPDYFAD